MERPAKLQRLAGTREALRSAVRGMDEEIEIAGRKAHSLRHQIDEALQNRDFTRGSQKHETLLSQLETTLAAEDTIRTRRAALSRDLAQLAATVDRLEAWWRAQGEGLQALEVSR